MKEQILKIAKDLEQGTITDDQAQNLLLGLFGVSQSNSTDLETIENKIIECLNDADDKLNVDDFSRLSESIIEYIDEIGRSKR